MQRLIPGVVVAWHDQQWVVTDLVGLDNAELRAAKGRGKAVAPLAELTSVSTPPPRVGSHSISDAQWDEALKIFQALHPLIGTPRYQRGVTEIDAVAAKLGRSRSTVYAMLAKWDTRERVSDFVRKTRSDRGSLRMKQEVRAIVEREIDQFHAREERPSFADTWRSVRFACMDARLDPPSRDAVVRAIRLRNPRAMDTARYGAKRAREKYEPLRGSFPNADFPLAVVQIDHTPIDLILVSDHDRQPVDRAYLTLVIDVCTRTVPGFCVAFEHPGALTAALALSHAILPKDEWLRERGIEGTWPIWGKPRKVHADNAKEFRGTALSRGCSEHGIILENRPKGQPQYGGTIERSFRTFMAQTHTVRGTTFSNTQQRMEYDSAGRAIMTISDYEKWLAIYLVYSYHNDKHTGIDYPPLKLYEKHILGDDNTPGIGQPAPISDRRRLILDFLPHVERTVQTYGIAMDGIQYWDDPLRRWVGAKDPENPKMARRFIVAYDPRDMSLVHFYDPDLQDYVPIPYRDRSRPAVSIWEIRKARREVLADPNRQPDEEAIFAGIQLMRAVETESMEKTKKARKDATRRKARERGAKALGRLIAKPKVSHSATAERPAVEDDDGPILPYPVEEPGDE